LSICFCFWAPSIFLLGDWYELVSLNIIDIPTSKSLPVPRKIGQQQG
jgi:hypothetical protein